MELELITAFCGGVMILYGEGTVNSQIPEINGQDAN